MKSDKEFTSAEIGALITSWNAATAPHRAYVNRIRMTGATCGTCNGTGEVADGGKRRAVCLCCDGAGKNPRWQ